MRTHPTNSWSTRIAVAAMAVAAISATSACSSSTPTMSSDIPGMSSAAPSSQSGQSSAAVTGQHMAASEFATAMKQPGTVVLDVRTPAEFASGHLAAARNIDIEGADFAAQIGALDKNATYAVYCRSGNRSGAALEHMTAAGFTRTYDLTGGIGAWQDMGGPMTMGRS